MHLPVGERVLVLVSFGTNGFWPGSCCDIWGVLRVFKFILAPYPVSMGCQSSIINYLTSTFFLREIRLISQLKSDWSKPKKAIITVTSRIYCFWLSLKDVFFHTSRMPQMETSCKAGLSMTHHHIGIILTLSKGSTGWSHRVVQQKEDKVALLKKQSEIQKVTHI